MKSFLLKGKQPTIKWGSLPDGILFKGKVPESYSLGVTPSKGFIVVDVDKHGDIDGFDNIPKDIQKELKKNCYNYPTKNNGRHYWMKYTGNKPLGNKASGLGIDLRTDRGYVVWYPKESNRFVERLTGESSKKMNKWLEKLFSYV